MVKKKEPAPSHPPKQKHTSKTPMQHAAEAVNRAAEGLTPIYRSREAALEAIAIQLYHDMVELREKFIVGHPSIKRSAYRAPSVEQEVSRMNRGGK